MHIRSVMLYRKITPCKPTPQTTFSASTPDSGVRRALLQEDILSCSITPCHIISYYIIYNILYHIISYHTISIIYPHIILYHIIITIPLHITVYHIILY